MPAARTLLTRLVLLSPMIALTFGATRLAEAATLSGWTETDTHAVALSNAQDMGEAVANAPLQMLASLKLRNTSVLYGFFQHLTTKGDPLYGHYLHAGQFAASYSPTIAEAQSVAAYLTSQGFSNISVSDNRTTIRFSGTVAQAETAFATDIHNLSLNGSTVMANVKPALVPGALGNVVLSISGLNTVPTLHLAKHTRVTNGALPPGPPSTNSLAGYSPQQYQAAYDIDPASDGSQTNIAIIAEGDLTTVLTDLVAFEDMYKLTHVTYSVIPTGFDHTDVSGADEFDLDTQSSTGLAGNVKHLYIYDGAALSDVELIDEYNHYVIDDLAQAASASVAGCESTEYAFGELSAYDQVFLQMATQGQTLFNSTGDSGSSCLNPAGNGIPAGVPGVEYPASSPYVVGVGGTTLLVNADNTYNYEIAWYSGGGGTSVFETAPSWQLPVLPTGTAAASGVVMKGLPDIAMDADPNTGAIVIVAGAAETIGGTSLASPLALGAWARMQSANGNGLGFAPPDLYAMATAPLTPASGFNDVIVGSNVGFTATPGWDFTTGLGSFDIAALSKLLKPVAAGLTPPPADGGSSCMLPGYLLATGVAGSQVDHVPGHNALAIYVAEPAASTGADDTFVFSLQVDSLANIPPETGYFYYFFLPDGSEHYVAYESTPDPTATSNFSYGTITTTMTATLLINYVPTQVGYTDAGSMLDTTNNRVVWVLKKSEISGYVEGQSPLTRIYGEVDIETTPVADNQGQSTTQPVDDTPQGNYTPVGNTCAAGTTTGGTTGTTTGSTTGGTTGTTTGGTTGGSTGTSTGGTTGGSTGTSTGGTTGSSPAPVTGASSGASPTGDARLSGGAFGLGLIPLLLAGLFRRGRSRLR
jgi:pseudomonalisin/xanthomonalisin